MNDLLDDYDELLARVHVMRPWIRRAPERVYPATPMSWAELRASTKRHRLREKWQRILVALDARASDDEATALEMFNVHTGEAAIDVNAAYTTNITDRPYTDVLRSGPAGLGACRRSKVFRSCVWYEDVFDGDDIYDDDGREPTAEEKREQVRNIVRAQRTCPLFGPISGIPWRHRPSARQRLAARSSSVGATFDSILKTYYTDEKIKDLAAQEHPFFASMKKETDDTLQSLRESITHAQYAIVHPDTYKDLEVQFGSAKMKVVASPYVQAGTAYVIPLSLHDLQKYATLDYFKARVENAPDEVLDAKRQVVEMVNADIAKSLEYSTAPLHISPEDK